MPVTAAIANIAVEVRNPRELRDQATLAYRDHARRIVSERELLDLFGPPTDPKIGACLSFLVLRRITGTLSAVAA